ncbi:DUF4368 domain-containing protein [Christensenella tenuis]|uniref:DUF4368 domain-containing protein n=1 Tax=Christensenella tenuis TaxID=2763033 RepID=A0ABR7EHK7_9FIRM|nr:DUF4368 domain-containing protein [Christensenella tenuis]
MNATGKNLRRFSFKRIVTGSIERIVIHQAQRIDRQRTQQIDIYYRFIGKLY